MGANLVAFWPFDSNLKSGEPATVGVPVSVSRVVGGAMKGGGHGGADRAAAGLVGCIQAHHRGLERWGCNRGWKPKGLCTLGDCHIGNACTRLPSACDGHVRVCVSRGVF